MFQNESRCSAYNLRESRSFGLQAPEPMNATTVDILWIRLAVDATASLEPVLAAVDRWTIRPVESVEQAVAVARETAPWAALLSVAPDGADIAETVAAFRDGAPRTPLVLLGVGCEQEAVVPALRAGAQDCLAIEGLDASRLRRAVDFAAQRHLAARSQAVLAALANLSHSPGRVVAAELYGDEPVAVSAPQAQQQLQRRYGALLRLAVDQRVHRQQDKLSEELVSLAQRLGALRAGPRDVMTMHTQALRARLRQAAAAEVDALLDESRLLALRLMGELLLHYRRFSLAPRAGRPADPEDRE
jgi:DNA-binding NarL/FixJ family response regulator